MTSTKRTIPLIRNGAYFAGWLLIAVITALSLVPAAWRPETNTPHNLEHFVIFWLTGFAFGLAYERRPALIVGALVTFSAAIEIAQMLVPDRHARASDFVVDAVAASVGAAIASMILRMAAKRLGNDAQRSA
jgi:VanZ family protein